MEKTPIIFNASFGYLLYSKWFMSFAYIYQITIDNNPYSRT